MAKHPRPPQFGTPWNANGFTAHPISASGVDMTQYSYPIPGNISYLNEHPLPNGQMAPANVNSSSFHVNGHSVRTPSNEVNENGHAYDGQSHSHLYQPLPSAQHTDQSAYHQTRLPSQCPESQPNVIDAQLPVEEEQGVDPAVSDIEDGEVDDEGIDKPSNTSNVEDMGLSFSRVSTRTESGNDVLATAAHTASSGNVESSATTSDSSTQIEVQKKEEAKEALHALHHHGLNFDQIVEMGMNPEALRHVYAQAGIPLTQSDEVRRDTSGGSARGVSAEPKHLSKKYSLSSIQDNITSKPEQGDLNFDNHTPAAAATVLVDPVDVSNKTVSGTPQKSTNIKTTDPKSMDRKEYIARMLAAKAGKPLPPANTLMTSKVSTAIQAPTRNTDTDLSAQAAEIPSKPPTSSTTQDHADIEEKRKAKTDLARQKIEALRVQQEAKNASNSHTTKEARSNSKETAAEEPTQHTYTPTQPPALIRRDSYFSPISQNAPFALPGLFTTAAPATTTVPLPLISNDQSSIPAPLQNVQSPSPTSKQMPITKSLDIASSISTKVTQNSGTDALSSTHRKRQKAADFLDPPATRVKRPLGQQENTSVIIEISDEEMSDYSDKEEQHAKSANRMVMARGSKGNEYDKNHRVIEDLPPSREASVSERASAMTSTSAIDASNAKEAEGLKTKEMEIEIMNKKIAQLEQRISAKKTVSRAHTPGTFAPTNALVVASEARDGPDNINEAFRTASETANTISGQNATSAATSIADDKLEIVATEQIVRDIEEAKAEAERSLAANIANTREIEQMQSDSALAGTQQSQKPATPEDQLSPQEGLNYPQPETSSQVIPKGNGSHIAQLSDVDQAENNISRSQQQDTAEAQAASQAPLQQEDETQGLNEQRRQRRAAIESGIPRLDAVVERTQKKVETLRREIANLELEVKKGVEGRKVLMEELLSLSNDTKGHPDPAFTQTTDKRHGSPKLKLKQGIPPLSPYKQNPADSPHPQASTSDVQSTQQAQDTRPQPIPQAIRAQSSVSSEVVSDGELEEDVMDISRSDVDDVESPDHEPELHEVGNSPIINELETAESPQPPADINFTDGNRPGSAIDPDTVTHSTTSTASDKILDTFYGTSAGNAATLTEGMRSVNQELDTNTEESKNQQLGSMSTTDDTDSDEYEPPEPTLSEGETSPSASFATPPLPASSSIIAQQALATDDSNIPVAMIQQTVGTDTDDLEFPKSLAADIPQKSSQFIPYESPLKQFKSFRNHPGFLREVSNGFRSLTFSHAIDSVTPICRYEIDGICNDASCQSQHFKNLGLSDEKILVDLGEIPKDVDASAYTAGLKQLVQDIRSRKIKDVNKVASEITAYRRRFLGESKILSL